jgi:hypothetical protein
MALSGISVSQGREREMTDHHLEISEARLFFFEKQEIVVENIDASGLHFGHRWRRVNAGPLSRIWRISHDN